MISALHRTKAFGGVWHGGYGVTGSVFVALRLDNRDAAVGMIQASKSRLIEEAG